MLQGRILVLKGEGLPLSMNAESRSRVSAGLAHEVRNQLQQVMVSVLLNAVRVSPERGTLSLRTRVTPRHFVAEIEDSGPGISPIHQAKLFEPIFTSKRIGFGLSLARRLMKLPHCSLTVSNEPGGGARATLVLPFEPQN